MKKNVFLFAFAVLIALLTASCGSNDQTLRVVPKDAVYVMKMNVANLLQKSEVMNKPFVQDAMKKVDDPVAKEIIEQLKDDPMSAGVDITQPVVLAVSDLQKPQITFAAAIKSKDDFTKLLEKINTAKDAKGDIEVKAGDVNTIVVKGKTIAAYDDDVVVVSGSTSGAAVAPATLLAQKEEDSFLAVKNIDEFVASGDDIALFMDYEKIMGALQSAPGMNDMAKNAAVMIKDLAVFASINFEDGQAVSKSSVYGNEKYMAALENCAQDASGKFLSIVPQNSYFVAQMGINDYNSMFELLDKKISDMITQQTGVDVKKVLNSVHGDVLVAVAPNASNDIPYVMFALECKDATVWDLLKQPLSQMPGATATADGFTLDLAQQAGYNVSLTFKDNCLVLKPAANYMTESFEKSPLCSAMGKRGAVIDMESILKHPSFSNPQTAELVKSLSFLKTITLTSTAANSGELKITTEKGKNSLTQIADGVAGVAAFFFKSAASAFSSGMNQAIDEYNEEVSDNI